MTQIVYQDETGQEWVMATLRRPARELAKDINTGAIFFGYTRAYPPQRQRASIRGDELVMAVGDPPVELTARHYDVLFGLIDEMSAEAIARRLKISRRTVYMFIAELKERFGVSTRAMVVLRAVQLGLAAAREE